MIKFLVGVTQFFIALFVMIMFICACILGIALIDYMLDLDIKQNLNKTLGSRKRLKRIRTNVQEIFNNFDEPSWKERLDTMKPTEKSPYKTLVDYEKEIQDVKRYLDGSEKDSY